MKTQQHEYSIHGIKFSTIKISLPEIPGVELDRDHAETSPRQAPIRSNEDWTRHDRMLRGVSKGKEMMVHPAQWPVNASNQLWGQE